MRLWQGVAAALLVVGTARAETLTVAIPQKGNWDTSITEFAVQQGFFKDEGLEVTQIYTQGGAQTTQAVLSGSVDLAVASGTLGVIGAYAKGAPIRVLSAEITGASDLFWYVKADSPLKTMKDLGGKTIGFSEAGSSSNLVLLGLIQQAGVAAKPVAVGGVPNALTQLMSGQIDVGWSAVPFNLVAVKAGSLRILAKGEDVASFAHQTIRVNYTTLATLAAKPDAIARYNRAYVRALDWAYADPKAVELYAAGSGVPVDIAKQTIADFLSKASLQPYRVEGQEALLKEALDFKYIAKPTTPEEIAPMFSVMIKPPQ